MCVLFVFKSENQIHVTRNLRFHRGVLSQKHPLQPVSRHAVLILGLGVALRVGAAGRGALRGAQVVHEGQPILPTEVHKFDLAHTRIEVDAWGKLSDRNIIYTVNHQITGR